MKDKVVIYDDDGTKIETTYDQLVRLFIVTIEDYYNKKPKCGGNCKCKE